MIKKWNGETLLQQLGFTTNTRQGPRSLARMIDKVVKANGPVVPPRALRPLLKLAESAQEALVRKRYAGAIRDLQKLVKAGSDEKVFPDGRPDVVLKARAELERLHQQALAEFSKADDLVGAEPKQAKRIYQRLLRDFGAFPTLSADLKDALKGL